MQRSEIVRIMKKSIAERIRLEMDVSERNVDIIVMHNDGLTLRAIADTFGVSYQRIGQVIQRWNNILTKESQTVVRQNGRK